MALDKRTIGKIAERIAMNELEAHGYRATDLNKDGVSANADLLAARDGRVWQIQVKGSVNKPTDRWWVGYGHCTPEIIRRERAVFNSKDSFYKAEFVVFVAAKSPSDYRCFVLPVAKAELAAQLNLDAYYRKPRKRDGGERRPGKVWVHVEASKNERIDESLKKRERTLLQKYENAWDF